MFRVKVSKAWAGEHAKEYSSSIGPAASDGRGSTVGATGWWNTIRLWNGSMTTITRPQSSSRTPGWA